MAASGGRTDRHGSREGGGLEARWLQIQTQLTTGTSEMLSESSQLKEKEIRVEMIRCAIFKNVWRTTKDEDSGAKTMHGITPHKDEAEYAKKGRGQIFT